MPKVKLGQFELLGDAPVTWVFRDGVRPHTQAFDVDPKTADDLVNARGPLDLTVDDELMAAGLYVLGKEQSEHPFIHRVLAADVRWLWSYKLIKRSYNMRRHIGTKRVPGMADLPIEIQPVTDQVSYFGWSLFEKNGALPGAKWTAQRCLKDLSTVLRDWETSSGASRRSGFVRAILIDDQVGEAFEALSIENLVIDDTGDIALARLLKYLPEATVKITRMGHIHFYSKASGQEASVYNDILPEAVGHGHIMWIENRNIRPAKLRILFTVEAEIRHNINEPASKGTTVVESEGAREVENVLPIPDYNLVVSGQTMALGTWITFTQALNAWSTPPGYTSFDFAQIRKSFIPFMDLWTPMQLTGTPRPDENWLARVASIREHYRQTYRVNRKWMDASSSIRAYRVATVDPSTGQRSPSAAWVNYSIIPSQLMLFNALRGLGVSDTEKAPWVRNVRSYPASGDTLTSSDRAAPVVVEILDHDQGIVRLNFRQHFFYDTLLPSMVTMSGNESFASDGFPVEVGPSLDVTQRGVPLTWDTVFSSSIDNIPKLTDRHKGCFIITHIPASPNDERQLYAVEIAPEQIADLLPAPARAGLRDARGPVMEIRVPPSLETARVTWLDAREQDLEKLFGIREGVPDLTGLVLNDVSSVGGASLQAIALAIAARTYGILTDRLQGEAAGAMTLGVEPAGRVELVQHTIQPNGAMLTKIAMAEAIQPVDIVSFLDSPTRHLLLKLAVPDTTR